MNFSKEETGIKDLVVISPRVFNDDRGFFYETYKKSAFVELGIADEFIQGNQSYSKQGVIRGLHFQTGNSAQAKLVRCLKGEIYDVGVDLRKDSSTFGQYRAVKLSAENKKMLYIPIGFAHGFSVLSEDSEVFYSVSGGEYDPKSEAGIRFDDPDLAIDWGVKNPIVSGKDLELPFFKDYSGF